MTSNQYDYYILGLEAAITSLQSSLMSYEYSVENHRGWDKEDYVRWESCAECLKSSISEIQGIINCVKEEDVA